MQDKHPWVQASAVQALALYQNEKTDTLKLLQDYFKVKHQDVKLAVVRSIAEHYSEQLDWLKERVVDPSVMEVAIESIAKYHKNEDVLASVKGFALNNKDKSVLPKALKSMAKCYPQKTEVLAWLEEYAGDKNQDVRSAAIQSISQHYLKYLLPDRVERLKQDILDLSGCPKSQKIAIQSIAKYYQQELSTLGWLQKCAKVATYESVRVAVVNSIVRYQQEYHKPEILK